MRLSVVIAVTADDAPITRLLGALSSPARADVEILIADGTAGGGLSSLAGDRARVLTMPGATLPQLKGAAVETAVGEVIAIIEPWDVPETGWVDAVLAALEDPDVAAAGGTVLYDPDGSAADAGGYLFEYAAFAPPLKAGVTEADLPGNNVAYRRTQLHDVCADLLEAEGFNKPFFHARIRERGGRLVIAPDMIVRHRTTHGLGALVASRHHYGRCFGATRLAHTSGRRRLLYRVFAPVLPVLLVLRYVARAWRPRTRRLLLSGGPALMLISAGWGLGEWFGYWFGAGRSCGKCH